MVQWAFELFAASRTVTIVFRVESSKGCAGYANDAGAQWEHLRRLLLDAPPTDWEQRLDWIQWYRYGWNNPLIHDAGAFAGTTMQHRLLVGVETLLRDRMRGVDAMGQLLYEVVAGGRDVEAEVAELEEQIRRIERERGSGIGRAAADAESSA